MGNIEKTKSDISKKSRPHPEWKVGDILLDIHRSDNPNLLKITKISKRKIRYDHWAHFTDGTEGWSSYGNSTWEEFDYYHICIKLEKEWSEYEKDALKEIQDIELLKKNLGLVGNSDETQLASSGNKEMLFAAKTELERRKNKVEIIRSVLQDKVNELSSITSNFRKQIQKIEKVIGVVELYLGVQEEIIQIQEGQPADILEPISIRQQLLFMDEEIGDPEEGGLDAYSLKGFDSWVCKPENLQRVLPEKKAIVALRVRRKEKNYHTNNPWLEAILNEGNFRTYFLIRNGENLYRIWANISVSPRLFPTKEELNGPEEDDYFGQRTFEKNEFEYKKYGLFLQSILHRTQIFQPLEKEIHVFQSETWNGMLNFIRDDEMLLPTGRLSWKEWQKEINKSIQIGSRVIYKKIRHHREKDFMRFRTNYMYGEWVPAPSTDIYEIVETANLDKSFELKYKFKYLPGDEVFKGWNYSKEFIGYQERKKRVGFWVFNDEILNYDQISLEDIDFYINCRTERSHYLDMMPILYMLKKIRKEELEREKLFVQLILQRNSNTTEKRVWELVDWWKFKNKWKRPIDKDDAKALRMIERKLKKELKNNERDEK